MKGALETALEALNLPPLNFAAAEVRHLRRGQAAVIRISKGENIGTMGALAEDIAALHKFRQPVFIAEVDLSTLLELEPQPVIYSPLPRYPSVVRDVSLLVDRRVTVASLLQEVADQKTEDCRATYLVGVFEGGSIPPDKRSATLRLEYRANDRTLRDPEVDEMHRQIVKALERKFGAEVR